MSCQHSVNALSAQSYDTVSTVLIDIPDNQVIFIAVTDGYTSSLPFAVINFITVSICCPLRMTRIDGGPKDLEFLHQDP